jgi:hypothetical protein
MTAPRPPLLGKFATNRRPIAVEQMNALSIEDMHFCSDTVMFEPDRVANLIEQFGGGAPRCVFAVLIWIPR